MKHWTICYPGDEDEAVYETLSEKQIIEQYFEYWSEKMRDIGKEQLISEARCIEDWTVVHWAWETDEFGNALDKQETMSDNE